MLKYTLRVLMHKFKKDILPVNFKPYFTNVNKIHNHLKIFLETNYFVPRVDNQYGF